MLKPGIHKDIPNKDYHADRTHLSSTGLKYLYKDLAKFYARYIAKTDEFGSSYAMDLGSYVHSLLLEPEKTEEEFIVYPGFRRGAEWEAFKAQHSDKIILNQSQMNKGEELADQAVKNPYLGLLLEGGEAELTGCANIDGIDIKVRADYINVDSGYIADVKTSRRGASELEIREAIADFDYDLSAALYMDTFSAAGKPIKDFYFIFISTSEDGDVCIVRRASEQMIENGRKKYKLAIKKYKEAKKTGIWTEKIKDLSLQDIKNIDMLERGEYSE